MKLLWLTDIHLNFLYQEERQAFYQKMVDTAADKVLITGDIAEAPSVAEILKEMAKAVNKPIYFVLGNHDYYRGKISEVKQSVIEMMQQEPLLYWLPASGPQDCGNDTILLGVDGWADGRYGDYAHSRVVLNDSRCINDLFQSSLLGRYQLLATMQQLADQDASVLKINLINAINTYHPKKVIILVHVPPFKELCLYEGKISNDDFLPFFSSKALGEVLLEIAAQHSHIAFLTLCGHTHSKASKEIGDNLIVKVGQAEYMRPEIQEIIT